jgi:3-hydroxybutyryl-CoA dehydrogenase
MGQGIANFLTMAGIETRLFDVDGRAVERGTSTIRGDLDKGVAKGKVQAGARDAALSRLSATTSLDEAIAGVQCAIEAVPESRVKQKLFATSAGASTRGAPRDEHVLALRDADRPVTPHRSASSGCTSSTPCTS